MLLEEPEAVLKYYQINANTFSTTLPTSYRCIVLHVEGIYLKYSEYTNNATLANAMLIFCSLPSCFDWRFILKVWKTFKHIFVTKTKGIVLLILLLGTKTAYWLLCPIEWRDFIACLTAMANNDGVVLTTMMILLQWLQWSEILAFV